MTTPRDETDRWADALAGREPPTDHATQEAASIRAVVEQRLARDLAPAADEQRQARLLRRLAEAGLRDAAVTLATPPQAAPNWLARLREWLWPEGGGPMRLGLVAAALAAVVALPLLQETSTPDESLRPRTTPLPAGDAPAPPGAAPTALRVLSVDPAQDANRLRALLEAQGLVVRVESGAADALVSAAVPADRRDAVANTLAMQGLALVEGQVQVRFVRQP